uniref:Mitoferrin-1 n=1 Tax=Lygus hesperus TaxID=30085 RepID=A0A0A9WRU4_LYGHE
MTHSDEYESLTENHRFVEHMVAGAMAGIIEHIIMFPLDTIKTRMQSMALKGKSTISGVFKDTRKEGGIFRTLRGFQISFLGDGPGHAVYFATYELLKEKLVSSGQVNVHVAHATSGMVSTVLRDAIMTPADAIKQRIQMKNSPYRGVTDCAIGVYKSEGLKAFYRAYTTQLSMNIPYQGLHFMAYEIGMTITNPKKKYSPLAHLVSGAIAGGFAAAVTTPLDVCKTYLNTQQEEGRPKTQGLFNAAKEVYKIGGTMGFLKGIRARTIYQMPSTAICWSIYEFWKWLLIPEGG